MRRALRIAMPTMVFAAWAWGPAGAAALPAPEELVPNTVARVSDVPVKTGTITKAEFRHALAQAAVQPGRERVPKPGTPAYEGLEKLAVDNLLEAIWLKGLAAEMGIVVNRRQIARELAQIKRESFESEAEYHEFLREARYTRRDVLERVELQLLRAPEYVTRRCSNGPPLESN